MKVSSSHFCALRSQLIPEITKHDCRTTKEVTIYDYVVTPFITKHCCFCCNFGTPCYCIEQWQKLLYEMARQTSLLPNTDASIWGIVSSSVLQILLNLLHATAELALKKSKYNWPFNILHSFSLGLQHGQSV